MGKVIDETGNRYGRLSILQRADPRRGRITWKCQCLCGNQVIVCGQDLRNGDTKSCGCWRKEFRTLPPGHSSRRAYLRANKTGAILRGYEWSISDEHYNNLTQKPCHYCGAKPQTLKVKPYYNGECLFNGLDRIDNTKGYLSSNVVPCCPHCNRAKMARSVEDFYVWAANVYHVFVEEKQGRTK